jgi:hypothetical protein
VVFDVRENVEVYLPGWHTVPLQLPVVAGTGGAGRARSGSGMLFA